MARVARSDQPLYQTRRRPVSWPVAITDPDGTPMDLTGASAVASLNWPGTSRALVVSPLDSSGAFKVSGASTLTSDLPIGQQQTELWLTVTDSRGAVIDYVWPVIGEIL